MIQVLGAGELELVGAVVLGSLALLDELEVLPGKQDSEGPDGGRDVGRAWQAEPSGLSRAPCALPLSLSLLLASASPKRQAHVHLTNGSRVPAVTGRLRCMNVCSRVEENLEPTQGLLVIPGAPSSA